jgi:hypothetical protein
MEIFQILGQFIYEAIVVLSRGRGEIQTALSATTVYQIVSASRSHDPVGEMVFSVDARLHPRNGKVREGLGKLAAREVRYTEFFGRRWKPVCPKHPVRNQQYASFLANPGVAVGKSAHAMELASSDPIVKHI